MLRLALLAALLFSQVALAQGGEPVFTLAMDETEKTAKPQQAVAFMATIASRSSERVRIMFQLVANEGRLRPVTPAEVVLAPQGEPQSRLVVLFTVQTPYENGRVDETGAVKYRVTPADPDTKEAVGPAEDIVLTVRTVGTYVPGPQMFGVFVALGLAAFFLRRRAAA